MAKGLDVVMRWVRARQPSMAREHWDTQLRSQGIAYVHCDAPGAIPADILQPLLLQWSDEGYVIEEGDGWLLPYNAVYRILDDPGYQEAVRQAGFPPIRMLAPQLASRGSLADNDFVISITGWIDETGEAVEVDSVLGASASVRGQSVLLTNPTWMLIERIGEFARRPEAERNERSHRLAWGEIRRLATQAGARLDQFLFRTVVLTPERIRIGLRRGDIPGDKLVEVMPDFDGSPPDWLKAFDAHSTVRDRYDILTPQGIVQVMITPPVQSVLEQIKRMPGRRATGSRAEAFVSNPFAVLGAEASSVIDADEFEAEQVRAGLTFDRFMVYSNRDPNGRLQEYGLLVETAQAADACTVRIALSKAAAQAFLSSAQASLAEKRQLFAWEEYEFELLGDTPEQLRKLGAWALEDSGPSADLIRSEIVLDLSLYSDRIREIGTEKPYASPYIKRADAEKGWFPGNIVCMLELPPTQAGGEPRFVEFSDTQIKELQENLRRATNSGEATIRIPGVPEPLPTADISRAVECFERVGADIQSGKLPEPDQKATTRSRRKGLVIKPNIDTVDYFKGRDILGVLPAPVPLPRALRSDISLKQHQLDGFNWLRHLFTCSPDRCSGAVLADDMGLGKTLQVLTLIAWAHEQEHNLAPALVIAPVALLENWSEEIKKFLNPGALVVLEAYGDALARVRVPRGNIDEQLKQDGLTRFLKAGWVGSANLVLTTYETLRDFEFSFAAERWSILICDEAQKIKNPNALVTRAAKKQNVRFRIACTGTPVENSLADLWCLFDFVQPGLLGALNEFGRRYRKPIEAKTDEERERVDELREQIKPQILRRLKSEVAQDLPKKIDNKDCKNLPISAQQRALYSSAVAQYAKRTDPEALTPFRDALGLLQYLRLLCTDPQPYGLGNFRAEPLVEYRRKAPKLDWLLKVLRSIKTRQEKAIVFCEFKEIQRLLQHYIANEFEYSADIINGETSASSASDQSRQKRIRRFQEQPGFGVIILSPLAVGFGLNIQAANHVIHYTRTWNPAKEEQATDRAYRIGQTRDVHVYCPVVRAPDFTTFDEKLDQLLTFKRELAQDMLNGSGDVGPAEFDLGQVAPPGSDPGDSRRLTLDDVLGMQPRYFEAFTAALWGRLGYPQVMLTPQSGDRGVDVVAIRDSEGVLIQCKTSRRDGRELGWDAIKDVVTGEASYRAQFPRVEFRKVCITTQYFNPGAQDHARRNNVELVDQSRLVRLIADHMITLADIERMTCRDWRRHA